MFQSVQQSQYHRALQFRDHGYIVSNTKGQMSGILLQNLCSRQRGYFMDHERRQAVTAAGSGCVAALSVERYLVTKDLLIEFHQPQTEEVKKELPDRHVQAGFDITLTKHKGQYESPRLICVLSTPTCGPCRTLKPIPSKVIDEFDQNVHFVEIDIEEDPEIAEAAGIMGTLCVQF
ncbi:hypothetical protein SO802_032390 [Lithocarpus litseifolius]|uniref:Thioredoxin domain-containing protein n=1 Tax=Lithocarpus litseifolius TaxID=425828 RepID=A0AAW2BRN5_9ROSI